jgi:hypothetical protein
MLMRQKDMPHARERNTSEHQLTGDAVTTVDHVCRSIDDDDLRWCRTRLSGTRAASGSQEDESASFLGVGKSGR